jgi:NAD(P)-dependent dehydrogenase (short-subunit alcohol dehydrogenase family)
MALELSSRGFRVFAGVRKIGDADSLIKESSGSLSPLVLDVTQTDSIAAAVQEVSREVGDKGLAGLVNNAGIARFGPVEEASIECMEEQFRVNVIGVIAVTQRFLPLLRRGRGRVVNISSVNGRISFPFTGIYSASKFALEAISDALRMELKPWGITVSVVEPGVTSTDIRARAMQAWAKDRQSLSPEKGRLYEPSYEKSCSLIAGLDQAAAGHENVTNAVVDALTAEVPRTRSLVGPDANQYREMLALPDEERDKILLGLWR